MEQTFSIEFELENADGYPFKLVAEGKAYWAVDPSYGEDIDGNRGQQAVTLEDFDVTRIVEVVTGFERYDLIAEDEAIEIIKERLLEDGPEMD